MYHSCHRRKKLTWESPLPFDITQPSSVITHAPFYASTHADLFTSIQALQQDFPLCRVGPSSYHTTGCHAVLQSIRSIVCDSSVVSRPMHSEALLKQFLQEHGQAAACLTQPTVAHLSYCLQIHCRSSSCIFWESPDNISNIFGKHFQRFQTF